MKSDESRRENSSRPIAVDDSAVAVTPVPRQGDTPPHPSCFRERGQVAPDDDRYRYFNPAERETAQRLEVLYPSVSLVSINAMDGRVWEDPRRPRRRPSGGAQAG
ncbi:MAG: hypothetical protein SW127_17585, partial [Actinomycetota bacterium]|nr:hypothetical protein [Actinomycetota bacterium]